MPKPNYDTSLARMAGNIAVGLLGDYRATYLTPAQKNTIAQESVDIARRIVAELIGFVPADRLTPSLGNDRLERD